MREDNFAFFASFANCVGRGIDLSCFRYGVGGWEGGWFICCEFDELLGGELLLLDDDDDDVLVLPNWRVPRSTPRGDPMTLLPILNGLWLCDDRFDEAPPPSFDDYLSDEFAPPADDDELLLFLDEEEE